MLIYAMPGRRRTNMRTFTSGFKNTAAAKQADQRKKQDTIPSFPGQFFSFHCNSFCVEVYN